MKHLSDRKPIVFKKGTRDSFRALGVTITTAFVGFLRDEAVRLSKRTHCSRCGGYGYSTHPTWAAHDSGTCYKCGGAGSVPVSFNERERKQIVKRWEAQS